MQKRTRLVGVDVNLFAALDGGADDAQRHPITAGSQRAGIAVRQNAAIIGHEFRAKRAHRLAGGDVLLVHHVRFGQEFFLDLDERRAGG